MNNPIDCVVINGRIVNHDSIVEADIGINQGKIIAIGQAGTMPRSKEVIDATGKHIFPGIIDPHQHPGVNRPFAQDIEIESKMCALGGVTTLIGTVKCTRLSDTYKRVSEPADVVSYKVVFPRAKEICDTLSTVDVGLTPALMTDEQCQEVPAYVSELGMTSFKFYQGYSWPADFTWPGFTANIGLPVSWDDGTVYLGFRNIAKAGGIALIHAENTHIVRILQPEVKKTARKDDLNTWHLRSPGWVEANHVATYGHLSRVTGCPLYVVHTCSKAGLEEIRFNKARGAKMISEVCPAYLIIDPNDPFPGILAKNNTPIQPLEDRNALWEGIRDGTVECVGTDHIGDYRKDRYVEGDIWETAGGMSSTQVMLPLMITEGHFKRGIPLETICKVCSYNNARYFGMLPRKGVVQVGADADLAIVDLDKPQKVDAEKYLMSSDFNVFHGRELKGWPMMTILRGKVIMKDGQVVGSPTGKYLFRSPINV